MHFFWSGESLFCEVILTDSIFFVCNYATKEHKVLKDWNGKFDISIGYTHLFFSLVSESFISLFLWIVLSGIFAFFQFLLQSPSSSMHRLCICENDESLLFNCTLVLAFVRLIVLKGTQSTCRYGKEKHNPFFMLNFPLHV